MAGRGAGSKQWSSETTPREVWKVRARVGEQAPPRSHRRPSLSAGGSQGVPPLGRSFLLGVLFATFAVGCSGVPAKGSFSPGFSASDGDRIDRSGFPTRDGWTSIGDQNWAVTTLWIPGLAVRADEDESEPGSGLEFEADLDSGEGNAIHLQHFSGDGTAIGFTYLTTEHTERDTDTHARTHSATIDFSVNAALHVDGPFVPFVEAGGGLGVAGIDFNGPIDDTFGGAAAGRAHVGVRMFDALDVIVGGGVFLWGYPGETIGRGAYWSVGATLRF